MVAGRETTNRCRESFEHFLLYKYIPATYKSEIRSSFDEWPIYSWECVKRIGWRIAINCFIYCSKSGHTRGLTVDLTLLATEKELYMGGTFDCFGHESHPDFGGNPDTGVYTPNDSINPNSLSLWERLGEGKRDVTMWRLYCLQVGEKALPWSRKAQPESRSYNIKKR